MTTDQSAMNAPPDTMTTDQSIVDAPPDTGDVVPEGVKINPKLAKALHVQALGESSGVAQAQDQPVTDSGIDTSAAKSALEERKRLMPEYLDHFFLEDLPPIDTEDPFNQGIYMRYRLNQIRDVSGKEPVL